jgi:microsomal dipeptidase-like Zn-dependent dipeptidase
MTRQGSVAFKALVALVIVVAIAFAVLPGIVDRRMNTVVPTPMPEVSKEALALHKSIVVADMHADELLWGRDPLVRVDHGHVDVPRLLQGNVALQVFSAVTKTPRDMNYDHNTDKTDNILLLAIVQRWPMATWQSLLARAMYQSERLHDAAARSNGALTIVTTREELAAFMIKRATNPNMVAGLLAIEGLHALDGKLESVNTLYGAGYRMMGLTHFFDNEVAASAHGVTHAGLTPFGRTVIARMDSLHIIVDLAHSSPQTIDDVLAIATRPMVVSHTGVAATCPGPRNLTDDQLRRIAAKGGLIGIGYWDAAVCTLGVESIVKAIMHAAEIMGADHVALGSDFDGATHTPFDTRDLARITDGLLRAKMSTDDIRRVMGANVLDFLNKALPER